MILYLDTSSLVKLYLEEVYSDSVQDWVREAEIVATFRVAFPEAMSAIGRRSRNGDVDATGFKQVCKALKDQWKQLAVIDMCQIVQHTKKERIITKARNTENTKRSISNLKV